MNVQQELIEIVASAAKPLGIDIMLQRIRLILIF